MKSKNPVMKSAVLLALLAGALLIFVYYYETAGGRLPFASHLYTVTAKVQDHQGLLKHADVRAAGVKVGTVSNISNTATSQGVIAEVQMQLDPGYAPIYRDATVLVRQKTLVGENYIDLARGLPKYGQVPDGGTLPLTHDLESVPLDKILNSLTPPVRREVQIDLRSLGDGLHNEGEHLNEFLGQLEPTVQNGGTILQLLNAQKQQVADVVQQTGTVMEALANRTQELRSLVTGGMQTAVAVAARDSALESSLADLPATLAQAQTSVAKLSSFSGLATPVISNLRVAVTNLEPVIHQLKPTAASARTLFNDLPPFLRVANPLLTNLSTFSTAAAPAVPSLEAFLRQTNPALDYLKPFSADVGSMLENFGSSLMRENGTGDYMGRCLCPISVESYTGLTPTEQTLVTALIKAGGLGGIANQNWNGLRGPGTQPDASARFSGTYPHIQVAPPPGLKRP
jgi:phospholipid/cholesterol/gamma-HCH transport system substrate-binding protein